MGQRQVCPCNPMPFFVANGSGPQGVLKLCWSTNVQSLGGLNPAVKGCPLPDGIYGCRAFPTQLSLAQPQAGDPDATTFPFCFSVALLVDGMTSCVLVVE